MFNVQSIILTVNAVIAVQPSVHRTGRGNRSNWYNRSPSCHQRRDPRATHGNQNLADNACFKESPPAIDSTVLPATQTKTLRC